MADYWCRTCEIVVPERDKKLGVIGGPDGTTTHSYHECGRDTHIVEMWSGQKARS